MPTFNPNNVLMMNKMTGKVPTEQATLILQDVITDSAIMQIAKNEPMTKPKKEFSYYAGGIGAYWVGEAERIQTSSPQWMTAVMEAKKLGVIVPVSREFLDYNMADFFEMIKPSIAEAFSKKFDQAAMWGTDSPFGATQNLWANIQNSGNHTPLTTNLYKDVSGLITMLEEDDTEPDGILLPARNRRILRDSVDSQGRPIFSDPVNGDVGRVLGLPVATPRKDTWDYDKAVALTGDWDNARYSVLKDISYAISTDATLTTVTDETGEPINLFERDMVALRATAEFGFMVLKQGGFAALTPAAQG